MVQVPAGDTAAVGGRHGLLRARPVIAALRERVEHGVFGYGKEPPELRAVLVERLQRLYGWQVAPECWFSCRAW